MCDLDVKLIVNGELTYYRTDAVRDRDAEITERVFGPESE